MAHKLDMSNGRANIAYVGETPWHGMGTLMSEGMTTEAWAQAAGMDWSAIKVPAGYRIGNEWREEPGQWAVIRDDTFTRLGTFTDRYKIVQPTDVLNFFRDFILTDDRFTMETAGCLKGGGVVWGLAKFNEHMSVMGEDHAPYVMLTTSFDGSLATTAQATMIRVVCNNTLQGSLFSKNAATVKIRHSTVWDEKAQKNAHASLEAIAGDFDQYRVMAEGLAGIRIGRQATEDFFKALIGDDETKEKKNKAKANQLEKLFAALDTTEKEGTDPDTAWTVFNAVTRYVDHDRATRASTAESEEAARMTAKFFGTGATMKAKALELLQAA